MINLQQEFIKDNIFDKSKFKKFKKEFLEFEQKYNKKKSISVSSRKAKGRSFQQYVRDIFRFVYIQNHNDLVNEDIECTLMGEHGLDLKYSPLAEKYIPYDVECKNQESFNIYQTITQCISNTKKGRIPFIVFKKNNLKPWISMPLSDFIKDRFSLDINNLKESDGEEETIR